MKDEKGVRITVPPPPHSLSLSLTEVVSTQLVCLVSSHDKTYVLIILVLHKLDIPHSTLLPLWVVRAEVKPE